jgi:phosphopantothenoylcysteine synthetase/decarboxylase
MCKGAGMDSRPSVIVTCGPAYEPIDEVRRLTNHSTGELGVVLANRLAEAQWAVTCLMGVGATCCEPLAPSVRRVPFTTNDDLLGRLSELPGREGFAAVFHAAALCDFRVRQTLGAEGAPLHGPKISSRRGEITLVLEPAPKVIGQLRGLFPGSRVVGWKYELGGSREEVFETGRRQIQENGTDACVVNGAAYGDGFGVLLRGGGEHHLETKALLAQWVVHWLGQKE